MIDTQTRKAYDTAAQEYDAETAAFWSTFPREYIGRFLTAAPGNKILNVGSGPGRDALLLQEGGAQVLCLDASVAMIALAKNNGLEALWGDFCALPFPDASYDGVWAYTSLLHTPKKDIAQPLREIRRVLHPEGVLALGMIEGNWEGWYSSSGMPEKRYFSFYTVPELVELLQQHGFAVFYVQTIQPKSKCYIHLLARTRNKK